VGFSLETDVTTARGTVLRSEPADATTLMLGRTVTIVVATSPTPATTPTATPTPTPAGPSAPAAGG